MGESFQKLNLTNAYLFAAAMQDEEICRNVLEIALNKRISRVKAHVEQAAIIRRSWMLHLYGPGRIISS